MDQSATLILGDPVVHFKVVILGFNDEVVHVDFQIVTRMEMENSQKRKRTRDQGDDKRESHKGKKPESISSMDEDEKGYEFRDGIGVFDFPWLKEGVIFKADDYLEPEEKFSPSSYLDHDQVSANLDQCCVQNSLVSPAMPGSSNLHDDKELDDDRFLRVDDLETIDCIWSCVIDQPLDVGLISKG
ncbi:hypothetical protein Salat_0284700 [Sesamum alatum]|uniref:Uncharacterized protein n=1 Tax=Sesamum alatum TaxID=300844 RepID=A0AAE1Z178_9LAMI|nr:hypothetical protein Salat_0284700 [Sesamum alatum]